MPVTLSPLRYPGGKTVLAGFIADVIKSNDMIGCNYVEPFAGGAGVAISLLRKNLVNDVILNDLDRSVYCLWHCVLHRTDELCRRIITTKISVDEWLKQKSVQDDENSSEEDLGFSTLFLNRVNYSGVIRGGLIGGLEQNGKYKMDCRFNKRALVEKINSIARMGDRIELYGEDCCELLKSLDKIVGKDTLVYLDPPYYCAGKTLYLNDLNHGEHKRLKTRLARIKQNWLMTYDCAPEINEIYSDRARKQFRLTYSAHAKKKGKEILLWGKGLKIPKSLPGLIRHVRPKGKSSRVS